MTKIASNSWIYSTYGVGSNNSQCPKKSIITGYGCTVNGSYSDNQLVKESDIDYIVDYGTLWQYSVSVSGSNINSENSFALSYGWYPSSEVSISSGTLNAMNLSPELTVEYGSYSSGEVTMNDLGGNFYEKSGYSITRLDSYAIIGYLTDNLGSFSQVGSNNLVQANGGSFGNFSFTDPGGNGSYYIVVHLVDPMTSSNLVGNTESINVYINPVMGTGTSHMMIAGTMITLPWDLNDFTFVVDGSFT